MKSVTITTAELWNCMLQYTEAMPFQTAHNLALAEVLDKHGIRMSKRSTFGQEAPEIATPFERSFDPSQMAWTIRQVTPRVVAKDRP
jgi:hypothetical protein